MKCASRGGGHGTGGSDKPPVPASLQALIPPKYRYAASTGNTPEEIQAWREARRKNYPTDANIARKVFARVLLRRPCSTLLLTSFSPLTSAQPLPRTVRPPPLSSSSTTSDAPCEHTLYPEVLDSSPPCIQHCLHRSLLFTPPPPNLTDLLDLGGNRGENC